MAKQKYEDKRIISICGVLESNEGTGEYTINVEDKDDMETFSFDDIMRECSGRVISFTCEL